MAGEKDLVTPLQLFEKEKRFCRDNIMFKSIKNAGHFPWIENPSAVAKELKAHSLSVKKFGQRLKNVRADHRESHDQLP